MLTVGIRTISARGLEYREFQPDPALAEDVEYLWTMRASRRLEAPLAQTSASKSSLDLIVRVEGNFCAHAEQHLFGGARGGAYLVGALSQPRTIITAGRCVAAGVRFRPGRAHAVFRQPMHELTDGVLDLASLDARLERSLTAQAQDAATEADQVRALQRALCGRAERARRAGSREAALAAMRLIDRTGGTVTVEAMARATGRCVRQLERHFLEVVGVGPKLACRIARVRRAMTLLPLQPGVTWTSIALDCGFYDQAHLIREFRALAGATPSRFADGCTALPDEGQAMSHPYKTASQHGDTVRGVDHRREEPTNASQPRSIAVPEGRPLRAHLPRGTPGA